MVEINLWVALAKFDFLKDYTGHQAKNLNIYSQYIDLSDILSDSRENQFYKVLQLVWRTRYAE